MRKSLWTIALSLLLIPFGAILAEEPAPALDLDAQAVSWSVGSTVCGNVICTKNETCCSPSCSLCVPSGGACPDVICPDLAAEGLDLAEPVEKAGKACGSSTCGPGERCCNPECGLCAPAGGPCPLIGCPLKEGDSPVTGAEAELLWTSGRPCGPTTCDPGQVCCNESCGICTPPGGFCTQQICEPGG